MENSTTTPTETNSNPTNENTATSTATSTPTTTPTPTTTSNNNESSTTTSTYGSSLRKPNLTPTVTFENKPPKEGLVLMAGGINYETIFKKKTVDKNDCLYTPNLFTNLSDKKICYIGSGCSALHAIAISMDGKCYGFGKNDNYQLGLNDKINRSSPTLIQSLSSKQIKIVKAVCAKNHTLFLTDNGKVYSCGRNSEGQCGLGSTKEYISIPTLISKGIPSTAVVVDITCGVDFSHILLKDGTVYSFGHPGNGVLGQGTNGEYIAKAGQLSYRFVDVPTLVKGDIAGKKIVRISSGNQHTVCLDSNGMVYSWGFGGYGRLGHNNQIDCLIPKQITFFDQKKPVKYITCGYSVTLYFTYLNQVFASGQVGKRSGEAFMYPKPIQDMVGMSASFASCGDTSISVYFEEEIKTVAFGSPISYGELGYGENETKSSTTPKYVNPLDSISLLQISAGACFTLYLADSSDQTTKTKIEKLPKFSPEDKNIPNNSNSNNDNENNNESKKGSKKRVQEEEKETDEEEEEEEEEEEDDDDEDDKPKKGKGKAKPKGKGKGKKATTAKKSRK